ncbi:unnamed protein product, partial [Acanthoscelides obtectus]
EAVKNKWRGLRDTFRKELNKLQVENYGILEPEVNAQSGNDDEEPDDLPEDDFVVETTENAAVD